MPSSTGRWRRCTCGRGGIEAVVGVRGYAQAMELELKLKLAWRTLARAIDEGRRLRLEHAASKIEPTKV